MKQVIVIRDDLGLSSGKLAAQVAHASQHALANADADHRRIWESNGSPKIVLQGEDESHLESLQQTAATRSLPHSLIRDQGRTELEPNTVTALGIGPAPSETIDNVTGDLSLL